ncbi:MAG: acylphosphatase [Alphaproteobacteria bacterium]|nr:MAG: acylphosphatase [Alphaproteobacteria bacterium]
MFAYGRVQAVGYRDWVVREARNLGLDGTVRNVDDGTVEIIVGGPRALVSRLESRCWQGPPLAAVFWLDCVPIDQPLHLHPGSGFARVPSVRRSAIR